MEGPAGQSERPEEFHGNMPGPGKHMPMHYMRKNTVNFGQAIQHLQTPSLTKVSLMIRLD